MSTLKVNAIRHNSASSDAITTASDGTCTAQVTNNLSNRNLIINGDMAIAQRTTSASGKTTGGVFATDRMLADIGTAGTWTISQDSTSPDGFSKSTKFQCTTANTSLSASSFLLFQHRLEGCNLQSLAKGTSAAKTFTVSFHVRSNKTGTYVLGINDRDNSRNNSKSYTISSANTWEKKTITFEADTSGALDDDVNESMRLDFWLGAGSNFKSGSAVTGWESNNNVNRAASLNVNLADSTSNNWYITGLQMEVGSNATDFEFLPKVQQLAMCQRYMYRCQDRMVGKGQNSADMYNPRLDHPVEMRASPTLANGSFVTHSGSNGTPVIGNTRFVGGGGTLSVALHNNDNNWSTGAWVKLTGDIIAEL